MTADTSQAEKPGVPPSSGSSLLTFLVADVRGYTRFTSEYGDEAAARLADRFAALCDRVLSHHDGNVIELRGDEALTVFSSARAALTGAVALQEACREVAREDPSLPLFVGMGLDAGEPIPLRGGFRGGALNLAARLCSIAGPGEILASEAVTHLARKTEGLIFADRGPVTLKGIPAPVRVLQVARQGEIPADLPPLQPTLIRHPTNLPDDATPFIGRGAEIAAVASHIREPSVRLVTLTGPGGSGKTRLALQVGNTLLYDFPDGVFVCALAALSDPSLIPSTLAQVLSITEQTGRRLTETLVDRLRQRQMLVILDNFEHLLDGSDLVAELLDGCRDLHILVTSRIPLHLSREHEHAVPPLTVPDPRRSWTAADVAEYDSVALFVERARAARDSFTATDDSAAVIAEICARLDGLPLAIELAAARIKLFPPPALLERLSSRLKLLTGGARDRPTRQQTLRGAIDWSFSLLTEEEQALLARLSVFAGGWTFDAAEDVCEAEGSVDLLDGLASLVDKSLVQRQGDIEPRFSMLETIREYATERLDERGEGEVHRAAHAQHFLSLAVEADHHLLGSDQLRWLDRLEQDHGNLRAAVQWAIARKDVELGMTLAANLCRFWYWRGYFSESRALCSELLALPASGELAGLRAKLLEALAIIPMRQGDYALARTYLDEALPLARHAADRDFLALTLVSLAFVARLQGDFQVSRSALVEGLPLAREVGNAGQVARALHLFGLLALVADRDLDAAWELNEQSLALYREIGNQRMAAVVLGNMARVARSRGDLSAGRALLLESLAALRDLGDLGMIPQLLFTLAAIDADAGQLHRAVRLQASAEMMEEIVGARVWPESVQERDTWLPAAQGTLSDEDFGRIWAEGRVLTVEQALDYGLTEGGE